MYLITSGDYSYIRLLEMISNALFQVSIASKIFLFISVIAKYASLSLILNDVA